MRTKKFLAFFLALLLVINSIPFTVQKASAASVGSGTADDPYQIQTAQDMDNVRQDLNAYYEICNDIDLSAYTNWVPLGDVVNPFTGRIIGNGHRISGVTIGSAASPSQAYGYTGFFGYVSKSGVIQDLGVAVSVYNSSGSDCGGLAGKSEGYIVNCYVMGNVVSSAPDCNTGGLVGENAGHLVNCYGTANVTGGNLKALSYMGVGGLIGLNTGETGVTNCYFAGNVYGGEHSMAGAIVGYDYNGLVANCRWDEGGKISSAAGGLTIQAGINADTVIFLDSAYMKGSSAISISYMRDTHNTIAAASLTFAEVMNLGRGAINKNQLPSGVKASAWGPDTASTNNGYPVFTSASNAGVFSGGSGIITDPYIITTTAQFGSIQNNLTACYKLGNDIDFSAISSTWSPIGYTTFFAGGEYKFKGELDGNGYKIVNYNIGTASVPVASSARVGLFYFIDTTGSIKNLGLNCNIYKNGPVYAMVTDHNWGLIDNCYVTGNLVSIDSGAAPFVWMDDGVTVNCYASADVEGLAAAGFSFDNASHTIANSCATGDVSAQGWAGGFIDDTGSGLGPFNCYSTGNIKIANSGPGNVIGGFATYMSLSVNDYWNLSATQTVKNTVIDTVNKKGYYWSDASDLFRGQGLSSEIMKGTTNASISYFAAPSEAAGQVTANSFIEALNGGRGAVGKKFLHAVYNGVIYGNEEVLNQEVKLAEWAYVPGVNHDYPIPLTPQTPEISSQPAGKTVSSGNTISFHTVASVRDGGTISYQWQKSTDGTAWVNAADGAGAASGTYTTGNLAAYESGEKYRCLITNTLYGVATTTATDIVTITVKPSIQPLNQTVEAGNAVTFCVDSAGPYQWQVSSDGGINWADIAGANLPYYTTGVLAASDSGNKYRCVIGKPNTGLTSQVITEAATVTVTDPTVTVTGVILTPAAVSVQKGGSYTFGALVTGTNNPSQNVTWSLTGSSNPGTSISSAGVLTVAAGETAAVLTVRATSVANNAVYGTAGVTITNVPATVSSVTITPKTANVAKGSEFAFSAAVAGANNPSQTVTWGIYGNTSTSTAISSSGVLSIASEETASALTVKVVSCADITKLDIATVTVMSTTPPSAIVSYVTITPNTVSISKGSTYTFSAAVTGTNNPSQAVSWSVNGNNNAGTIINSSGVLAIATGETASTLTVTATSVADGTKSDTAKVTVSDAVSTAPTVDIVMINPASASVEKGGTKSFSAVVTGSNNPAQTVTWSVSGNSSANTVISSSGLLIVGTDETAVMLTVKAASTADNTKSGTAAVTVTSTSQPDATVSSVVVYMAGNSVRPGTTMTFIAAVAGTNNPPQTVTWSVSGHSSANTSISSSGVLTVGAGETANSLTIKAISTADSTKSGTATVTVSHADNTTTGDGGGGNSNGGSGNNGTGRGGGASSSGGFSTSNYNANVSGTDASGRAIPKTNLDIIVSQSTKNVSMKIGSAQIDNIMSGGKNVITIPSIPDITSYTVGLPAECLSNTGGQGSLTLQTDAASMLLPANMLANTGATGKTAELSIATGDKATLKEAVKGAIGNRPLVQLSLKIDGKEVSWNNPEAPVAVSIPYTPSAAELANPESIVIWYIDRNGNAVSIPNGHYDPASGKVNFTTTHFSNYAVGYNRVNFTDVVANAWYSKAVGFISARKITAGTGNGNYSPNAKLTRGEFIVMLLKAYDIDPDTNPKENFTDAGNTWYTNYLSAAKRLGISTGVGNNLFAPDKEITRQEMFTLLYNGLKLIGQLPSGKSAKSLSEFSDGNDMASWAKEAMDYLVKAGIITGSDGKLLPAEGTNRAQLAQVLYNLLAK